MPGEAATRWWLARTRAHRVAVYTREGELDST
jgi:hypothetical protein